ncbi:MAG: hypothetical protein RJB38_1632 [Pseudomonadota bacterium]|jgi:hypothetical protein
MSTPLPVIANVSRVVSKVVDRVTGDRSEVPLLVAAAAVEALKNHGISAQVFYGPAAWIEILENQQAIWAGCWGQSFHFWAATVFGEIVDLNTSVAHRKRGHAQPELKPLYSPPMLWSAELPRFYRYHPEGVAEIELTEEKDQRHFHLVQKELREKCRPDLLKGDQEEFPNEAILCPGRKLLDDSLGTFKQFDRALGVHGIPDVPPAFKF